jgi:competence protein ComEC
VFTRAKLKFFLLLFLIFSARIFFLRFPDYPIGQEVRVVGRLTEEPYLKDSNQIITLEEIHIFTGDFNKFSYGDKIEALGRLEQRVIENKKSEFWLYSDQIVILDRGEQAPVWIRFRRKLVNLRHALEAKFLAILPEPQASLLIGIILGGKTALPPDFFQNLRRTGTLHLVAASGFNISVVAGFLISALIFIFPRKIALLISFAGVFAYTLIAGAGPAVVRAAIMGTLAFLAQFLGREKEARRVLFLSAGLMIFLKPRLIFDVGFQLSFGATAGILFLLPFLERWRFFKKSLIGKEIGLTLVAQIGVLPIILYHFQAVSVFSLAANGLVGPLVPYIMKFGAILILPSFFSLNLARVLAIPAWVFLTAMVWVIEFFGQIDWGGLVVERFPLWGVGVYYLVLGGVLFLRKPQDMHFGKSVRREAGENGKGELAEYV